MTKLFGLLAVVVAFTVFIGAGATADSPGCNCDCNAHAAHPAADAPASK
jgi:hypothetical protein